MAPAIIAISIGGIMLYSAFKGISITSVFAGESGDTLDPHGAKYLGGNVGGGGNAVTGDLASGGSWTAPAGGAKSFKGPSSNLLDTLAGVAQNHFHLTITATTNGGHVFDSYHYRGRAFDASGSETNMRAFASYVQGNYLSSLMELIHNPGFSVKDGKQVPPLFFASVWEGHRNHVHVAM